MKPKDIILSAADIGKPKCPSDHYAENSEGLIMNKNLLLAVASSLVASSAAAMDVATFLAKVESLERMGVRAALSSDARLVMDEMNASNTALRSERLAAQAAGRRPAYCPDLHPRASSTEIVAALRTIPLARRPQVQVRNALRAFYARRYPCPA